MFTLVKALISRSMNGRNDNGWLLIIKNSIGLQTTTNTKTEELSSKTDSDASHRGESENLVFTARFDHVVGSMVSYFF